MENRRVKFSGHQTFVVRYGWLEKGYRFVSDGKSFGSPDAIVDLGVGKNMVSSIRYWIDVCGIVNGSDPSELGQRLLDVKSGWDPYLEDNNSITLTLDAKHQCRLFACRYGFIHIYAKPSLIKRSL